MKTALSALLASRAAGQARPATAQPGTDTAQRPLDWAQHIADASVDNLHRVTPSLYRSARLSKDDVPALQKLGIRTIISLRAFHSDERIVAGTSITLRRIPINTWHIEDEDMVKALKALRTVDEDGPVLIHCQHGADRTGLVSALYRILYQDWSRERALDELCNGGYGFHSMWRNITHYLKHVDIARLRSQIK